MERPRRTMVSGVTLHVVVFFFLLFRSWRGGTARPRNTLSMAFNPVSLPLRNQTNVKISLPSPLLHNTDNWGLPKSRSRVSLLPRFKIPRPEKLTSRRGRTEAEFIAYWLKTPSPFLTTRGCEGKFFCFVFVRGSKAWSSYHSRCRWVQ